MHSVRRIFIILGLLLCLTFIGTLGFRLIQGKPWIESAYMAVITLSTVGSRDAATNQTEMLFVMGYLTFGLAVFTYSLFTLGQTIFDAKFHEVIRRRRMNQKIQDLSNHYIICGLGRMGKTICDFLSQRKKKFVVIDTNETKLNQICENKGWLYVEGDAMADENLLLAGIERAKALATVLPADSDNVLVTLSSKMLNPKLQVVSRAGSDNAVLKMERAGATRVISPYSSGAIKMARLLMSPALEDFLEIAIDDGSDWELAELQITEKSPYLNKQLKETNLAELGIMIIGIRRTNGEKLLPPPGTALLTEGDCLFAFGDVSAINTMIGDIESVENVP